MIYDSYRFFVIKNESANKIAVSCYIFEIIELKAPDYSAKNSALTVATQNQMAVWRNR